MLKKKESLYESGSKEYARLFIMRHEGDYEDFKEFTKEDTEPLIEKAIQFIKMIDKKLKQFPT